MMPNRFIPAAEVLGDIKKSLDEMNKHKKTRIKWSRKSRKEKTGLSCFRDQQPKLRWLRGE